jgi:hypothetical protein
VKAITVGFGDRVVYLGSESWRTNPETGERTSWKEPGDVGKVVEIKPPRAGVGVIVVDGEEIEDPDRDGYAVVEWPHWGRALIWPDGEGKQWRRA